MNCCWGLTWCFWAADMFELQLLDMTISQATLKTITQQKCSNIHQETMHWQCSSWLLFQSQKANQHIINCSLRDDQSIKIQLTSAFTTAAISIYFGVIVLKFHRHITFHVDESELNLPSRGLLADSLMCAVICKPIVWHCNVSWSRRLSQRNCQVMKKFHTDCFSLWRHLFC